MARRVHQFIVDREGRDKGGVFTLTEMPAYDATELCMRVMQCIARGGTEVPPHIFQMGVGGFVAIGAGAILAGLGKTPWYEVKPLLDALLPCVTSFQPAAGTQALRGWEIIKGQIEEPATILQLYEEVVSLHLGFSLLARLSTFRTLAATMISELTPATSTSIDPLESS